MNTSKKKSAQNSEQTQPKTIHDLHEAFANLAFSYGMVNRKTANIALYCRDLEADCEELASIAKAMRLQAKDGAK